MKVQQIEKSMSRWIYLMLSGHQLIRSNILDISYQMDQSEGNNISSETRNLNSETTNALFLRSKCHQNPCLANDLGSKAGLQGQTIHSQPQESVQGQRQRQHPHTAQEGSKESENEKMRNYLQAHMKGAGRIRRGEMGCRQGSEQEQLVYCLCISNRETKYALQHGNQFKQMLEPRDRVLEHDFNFNISFRLQNIIEKSIVGSGFYKELKRRLQKFIVEAASNIVSIAFGFLNQGKLEQKETMDYAAKNILLNINSILRETLSAVNKNQLLQTLPLEELKRLEYQLTVDADQMLGDVMVNLADYYPQAAAAGGTPRMRETITEVNRAEDEENDLIFANKINICKYLSISTDDFGREVIDLEGKEDYTGFVMDVINTAIKATQSSSEDWGERTVKEKFVQFNQQLFWLAQQDNYRRIAKNMKCHDISKSIIDSFGLILQNESEKAQALKEESAKMKSLVRTVSRMSEEERELKMKEEGQKHALFQLLVGVEKGKEDLKKEAKYSIGQKIPSYLKEFNRQEMGQQQFTVKHSSILRILTKWNLYLEDIFQNPEKHVKQRLYPFKTVSNKLVNLRHNKNGDERLIEQLREEYEWVKSKMYSIVESSEKWIARFLTDQQQGQDSNVCRYSDTRKVASKINAVLVSCTLRYTNTLIYHLLKAGRGIGTEDSFANINLIVFKVSDLLRSKLQCSENSFVSLLQTMYLFDSSPQMKDKFKLVRIKNKLDTPSNNIIINYLFMGKVQCELQLSIQQPKGKQKRYYAFSHFVYELTRGKFGVLAECAIMTSQLDPLLTVSPGTIYAQKRSKSHLPLGLISKGSEFGMGDLIFECRKCGELVTNQKHTVFVEIGEFRKCNRCNISQTSPEEKINFEVSGEQLGKVLEKAIQQQQVARFTRFSKLITASNSKKLLLMVNEGGNLDLYLLIEAHKELRWFLVKLTSSFLENCHTNTYDFSSLDYIDITNEVVEQKQASCLIYTIENEPGPEILIKMAGINKKMLTASHFQLARESFLQYREEKGMIKSIKHKAEVLRVEEDREKWKALDKVVKVLGRKQMQSLPETVSEIKYKRHKHLDLSNIKQIYGKAVGIEEIPRWIFNLTSLQKLFLSKNRLNSLELSQIATLKILDLSSNQLTNLQLSDFPSLTSLFVGSNNLTSLKLEEFPSLKTVEADYNRLTLIELSNLPSLASLDVNYNKFTEIEVSSLPVLADLFMRSNQLKQVDLSQLPSLAVLDAFSNKLEYIELIELPALVTVYLHSNKLTEVRFKHLPSLSEVELGSNKLQKLDFSQLPALSSLNLQSNQLTSIALDKLPSLSKLNLNSNKLPSLELRSLPALAAVDVRFNKLTEIQLTDLPMLANLDLRSNRLADINLASLPSLNVVDLYSNKIRSINGKLPPGVRELYLDRQVVEELDVMELADLQILHISDEKIQRSMIKNIRDGLEVRYR